MLYGEWQTSASSVSGANPIQHFVFDNDAESYCGMTSHFVSSELGRRCFYCLLYLIKDGFLGTVERSGGQRQSHLRIVA